MWTKNTIIIFGFLLQFIAVLCLVLSTNGAPQNLNLTEQQYNYKRSSGPNPKEIALAKITNQGASIDTAFGNWKIIHIGSKI